jgi:hypothetical protein
LPELPVDPIFREVFRQLEAPLQVGRTNLGERYAEAVREFEERRVRREEAPPPPPPTDDEVAAWNRAMHAWHDQNRGFAETEEGRQDGTWTLGWGLPGGDSRVLDGSTSVGAGPALANPYALPRLSGSTAAPGLQEGLRELR